MSCHIKSSPSESFKLERLSAIVCYSFLQLHGSTQHCHQTRPDALNAILQQCSKIYSSRCSGVLQSIQHQANSCCCLSRSNVSATCQHQHRNHKAQLHLLAGSSPSHTFLGFTDQEWGLDLANLGSVCCLHLIGLVQLLAKPIGLPPRPANNKTSSFSPQVHSADVQMTANKPVCPTPPA
jgi:hypothetical protein